MTKRHTIGIDLAGATDQYALHCREVIHTLFEKGIFDIRNGNAELHFDHEGNLQLIRTHVDVFRRNKPAVLLQGASASASIKVLDGTLASEMAKRIQETAQ